MDPYLPGPGVQANSGGFDRTFLRTRRIVVMSAGDIGKRPGCAAFFLETMPLLDAEFVRTGKVKILHRDLPLPQHRYARLAARYANAAGSFGQYDLVVNQLFRTQRSWDSTGDIDKALMEVLPPGLLKKVRDQAANGGEQSIDADLGWARQNQIRGTPSLVVVAQGKRQVISPIPSYSLLKSYLESLLAK